MRFQALEIVEERLYKEGPPNLTSLKAQSYNSILGTGWGHSFAADGAEPSHHYAQESPQPWHLINLEANAYHYFRCRHLADRQAGLAERHQHAETFLSSVHPTCIGLNDESANLRNFYAE
ncbi:MAG TPA: hypothetical protein VK463_04030 [Desulfomonilaceae bacterium]|nr:hypothetical protein [Desulfomonilaceae bacterium]